MGAGKTAIGKSLAQALDVPFMDSDEEIVRAANMSIADIFARDGEAFFRERESEVIARLLTEKRCILSTGGGAFLSQRNRDIIAKNGYALWLKADLSLLWERVRQRTTRPLLQTDNPYKSLQEIYEARVPIYELAAGAAESRPEYSIEDMRNRVIAQLKQVPDLLEETP